MTPRKQEYMRLYRLKNKERIDKKAKAYNRKNSKKLKMYKTQYRLEHKAEIKEYNRQYKIKNKDKLRVLKRVYINDRVKKDPLFKAKEAIRHNIRISIYKKNYTKRSHTYEILGCSFNFFKDYIEKQFQPGMTWLNHGEWHLDHKIPLDTAKTEEDVIQLNHYTNFQPLWAKDNLAKWKHLDYRSY